MIILKECRSAMRNWKNYKDYVAGIDSKAKIDIDEMESIASIVYKMVETRNDLGISQRELAEMCGLPQSSVSRIESLKITPNLDTLIKIMSPLGLKLVVTKANS